MSRFEAAKKFENLINECDQLIRSGQITSVTSRIAKLNFAQVQRDSRQGLAKICRRVGLVSDGLRLLHPVIRGEKENEVPATSAEICEYAVLLSRNGSIQEAINLLKDVETDKNPEALLYLASLSFNDKTVRSLSWPAPFCFKI